MGRKKAVLESRSKLGVVDANESLMEKQIVCGYLNSSTPLKISKDSEDCLVVIEAENREAMAQSFSRRKLSSYIYSKLYSEKRDTLGDSSLKVFVSGNYLITDNLLDYKMFDNESISKILGEGKLAHISLPNVDLKKSLLKFSTFWSLDS